MSEPGTIRERIERASGFFQSREAVVLTTFNLSGQFLEDQAMPAILGVEGATAAARNAGLHGKLAETECTVFYDPTVPPGVSGKFRYVARPVPLRGRLFHPKLIIIAGRSQDGTPWVYLAVSSANLTLSGWGRNAESFGETWIHTKRQRQVWGGLDGFLAWLQRHAPLGEEPSDRDAVAVVRQALKGMPDVYRYRDQDQPWSGTLYARFYSSVVDKKGLPSFLRMGRARRPAELWAYSPYWGSVSELVREFGAHRTALVPAMSLDRKALGLSKSQHEALPVHTEVWRNRDEKEDDRFWHMKAYWVRFGERLVRTAVGSCNFTEKGLAGESGNVEAMLVFEEDIEPRWPNVVDGGSPEDFSEQPVDEEEVPTPVPVTIVVAYDWLSKSWRWFLEAGESQSDFQLSLPGLDAFPIVSGCGERHGDSPSFPARYTVTYTHGPRRKEWSGEVAEIHLHHTQRTYGKPLSASDILESWRLRVPKGDTASRKGGADGDEDGDDVQADTRAAFDAVNLYDLYRATRALGAKLAALDSEPQKQRALLMGRPDSVMSLARLAASPGEAPVVRYLVLRELASVVATCGGNLLDEKHVREVRQMERQAKKHNPQAARR